MWGLPFAVGLIVVFGLLVSHSILVGRSSGVRRLTVWVGWGKGVNGFGLRVGFRTISFSVFAVVCIRQYGVCCVVVGVARGIPFVAPVVHSVLSEL